MPIFQMKTQVADRKRFVCNADESRLLEPSSVQDAIDTAVAAIDTKLLPRAFVRPSGTEDVVRIYAECLDPPDKTDYSGNGTRSASLAKNIAAALDKYNQL
jgi:phosphomannomutase